MIFFPEFIILNISLFERRIKIMKRFFFAWPGILLIVHVLLGFGVIYSEGNSSMVSES